MRLKLRAKPGGGLAVFDDNGNRIDGVIAARLLWEEGQPVCVEIRLKPEIAVDVEAEVSSQPPAGEVAAPKGD